MYGSHQTASASSSPSSSTSSLLHPHSHAFTPFRSNSLHGNTYLTIGSNDTHSTFWPYRLLNCIMDQRDIAGPIIEVLCVDILRLV